MITVTYLAGQCIVKLRIRRITCTADDKQYAITRDLQTHTLSGEITCDTPRATEVPSPKHAVSEGLLALAEDKRPGANRSS